MRLNVQAAGLRVTHEGGHAKAISPYLELRRSVLACLLWEDEFYESGKTISQRIMELSKSVEPEKVAALAIEARHEQYLRHAPLLLLCALAENARGNTLVADTIYRVVHRADELAELTAIYWRDGKRPLSAQMKKGLARAFFKFDAYQFAKYDRDAKVKLSDVIRLVRPKPADEAQAALFKGVRQRSLTAPDTWEVGLSGGGEKKEVFERLIGERKLGYLALLRNLRNMVQAGCDLDVVRAAILARKGGADRVLPFRFIAAARAVPQLEPEIDTALCEGIASLPSLPGKTVVLVDVSGSMDYKLSAKSDMTRMDAAAALASVINADRRVYTFSNQIVEVPPRMGMAGVDAIVKSQMHSGTYLGNAIEVINDTVSCDRLIVITDEQVHDTVPDPRAKRGFMINVASNRNGVGYGRWTHIDGWSENVIRWIHEYEQNDG
jgi:60 kDa SS-A/Ro ribonucleoprotein